MFPQDNGVNILCDPVLWIYDRRCVGCGVRDTHVVSSDGYRCEKCARGDATQLSLFPTDRSIVPIV